MVYSTKGLFPGPKIVCRQDIFGVCILYNINQVMNIIGNISSRDTDLIFINNTRQYFSYSLSKSFSTFHFYIDQ